MIGKNKSQITASALNYALAAFVSVIVLIGGYKTVSLVREKACNTEMAKFEIDLKKLDESVRFGAKELQSHQTPCNVDKIYFLGSNKKAKPEYLKEIPIIEDALKSQSGNNIFLVKDNEVKRSFYAGNLEMMYPYYICFAPKFDKISFFVEGAGEYAKIAGACGQPECTLIPMNISENEARGVIQEAIDFGCVKCPTYLNGELENMKLTKEKVEMFRKFSVCGGITTVEITIKPKKGSDLKDIRVYELIPKECVDDLNNSLVGQIEGDVYIKSDPLIMWHFDELKKEEKVSYKLSKELSEDCMQAIQGLGVSQIKQFCRNRDDDCGDYPDCMNCSRQNGKCSDNNCICYGTSSSCGSFPNCQSCSSPQPPECIYPPSIGPTSRTYSSPGTCSGGSCSYALIDTPCAFGCSQNTGLCNIVPALSASCSANPTAIQTGQSATWSASASGGSGSYSYLWLADTEIEGNTDSTFTKSYSATGVKTGQVEVTSDSESVTVYCANSVTVSSPPQQCSDGTPKNTCSTANKGKYCYSNSQLGDNCDKCPPPCPSGYSCKRTAKLNSLCIGRCDDDCFVQLFPNGYSTSVRSGGCGFLFLNDKCDCYNDVCVLDCVPDCAGRQCGDNGCGGSCGTCSSGWSCEQATGNCKPLSASLSATLSCGPQCSVSCGANNFGSGGVYYFATKVEEKNGITVNLNEKCRETPAYGICPREYFCALLTGKSISGGGYVNLPGALLSDCSPRTVTETIRGTDIYNNPVSASHSFQISGC